MLAEMLVSQKDYIVGYHEHDSLLENQIDEELSEEDRKAAWEEYEAEKKGLIQRVAMPSMYTCRDLPGKIFEVSKASLVLIATGLFAKIWGHFLFVMNKAN